MSTDSSTDAFAETTDTTRGPSLPVTYVLWLILIWLIGVQATAGWQHSTDGISNYPKAMVDAFAFDVLFVLGLGVVRALKIQSGGISRALGFGFGAIFFAGAFPLFAALGSIWDAVGGTHPDPTGFPKIVSAVMMMR